VLAGGDEPDPAINPKFEHKLSFLDEMRAHLDLRPRKNKRAILVGDLNVAPLEHDVWSHKQMLKVVSHTPVECEKLTAARNAGGWIDSMRVHTPEPEKLYTWWSYRAMANWCTSDRGRRLDHVWTSDALAGRVSKITVLKNYRGAERPSDHVPVMARLEI
jgi:exodeoxyribonuclease-3